MIPAGVASGIKSFDAFAFVKKLAARGGNAGSIALTLKSDSSPKLFYIKGCIEVDIWKTFNPLRPWLNTSVRKGTKAVSSF